ncbi:hypothetical protein F0P96_10695 [Hymenobacter busanensis]|uniref:Uncharacterized protein n=1 Tax=Hymenobacter busanensis TaxID=2607656 RepID=A0A7L4ZWL3_9BACT|nr:hypothetical protein [Hymenobacter busanensis]KAA9333429.1 hypothetical protein F0P96_10695 [Hymenobacter busanensis]QHJ07889.1 hypothetical protein GUY19_11600 [Hymenobacter busanensis]
MSKRLGLSRLFEHAPEWAHTATSWFVGLLVLAFAFALVRGCSASAEDEERAALQAERQRVEAMKR